MKAYPFFFQCHLATLLKTAEDLKIKGLAEVSWRDEEQPGGEPNGVQTAIPQVQTVMPTSPSGMPNKRKRGRPPIDDYDQSFSTPKIASVSGAATDDTYSNDAMSSSEHDLNIWEEDQTGMENTENEEPPIKVKKEVVSIIEFYLLSSYFHYPFDLYFNYCSQLNSRANIVMGKNRILEIFTRSPKMSLCQSICCPVHQLVYPFISLLP